MTAKTRRDFFTKACNTLDPTLEITSSTDTQGRCCATVKETTLVFQQNTDTMEYRRANPPAFQFDGKLLSCKGLAQIVMSPWIKEVIDALVEDIEEEMEEREDFQHPDPVIYGLLLHLLLLLSQKTPSYQPQATVDGQWRGVWLQAEHTVTSFFQTKIGGCVGIISFPNSPEKQQKFENCDQDKLAKMTNIISYAEYVPM